LCIFPENTWTLEMCQRHEYKYKCNYNYNYLRLTVGYRGEGRAGEGKGGERMGDMTPQSARNKNKQIN